jgi:hypothetical protein
LETGEAPQYQGDVATFDDVQVRPLSEPIYEGYGDAQNQIGTQQTGYMVSAPLTGQYKGYFRNDLYDNDGNFLRTTISEPDNDPYGLKGLAQMGLMAASFGALGPVGQLAANAYSGVQAARKGDWLSAAASILPGVAQIPGVSPDLAGTLKTAGGYAKTASNLEKAIENKDVLGLLGAASDIPGVPKVPGGITDVLKGVGQASRIREAIRNEDPYAIFREVVGASKTGVGPKKLADITGEDAIEGFFARGGDGYYFSEDPGAYYGSDPSQEKYVDEDRLLGKYPAPTGDVEPAGPRTTMDPMEMNRFLEANIDDPATIAELLDQYYPQTIGVTGTKESPSFTPTNSIRDIGNVTQISPDEKLEIPEIPVPDLSVGLPTVSAPSPAPRPAPARAPTPTPAPDPSFTMPTTTGGGPTVHTPILANVQPFDVESMVMALANEAQMTPEDLMQILRG